MEFPDRVQVKEKTLYTRADYIQLLSKSLIRKLSYIIVFNSFA